MIGPCARCEPSRGMCTFGKLVLLGRCVLKLMNIARKGRSQRGEGGLCGTSLAALAGGFRNDDGGVLLWLCVGVEGCD